MTEKRPEVVAAPDHYMTERRPEVHAPPEVVLPFFDPAKVAFDETPQESAHPQIEQHQEQPLFIQQALTAPMYQQ